MISWYRASRSVDMISTQLEVATGVFQALDQRVDLGRCRVEVRRQPGRALHPEAGVSGLGAVVAGPHRDPPGVQHRGDVVGVHALELEGDRAPTPGRVERAEDGQARDGLQALE